MQISSSNELLTVIYNPQLHQKVTIISEILSRYEVVDILIKETSLEDIIKQIYVT
ncbi:hypothetical protein D3C75_1275440 [compost metagenome]